VTVGLGTELFLQILWCQAKESAANITDNNKTKKIEQYVNFFIVLLLVFKNSELEFVISLFP